jgi:hypothetical protein
MPINRLLQNSTLGPREIKKLVNAYEQTLRALSIKDRNDPLAETIAKMVMEMGQVGTRDAAEISRLTIKELGLP